MDEHTNDTDEPLKEKDPERQRIEVLYNWQHDLGRALEPHYKENERLLEALAREVLSEEEKRDIEGQVKAMPRAQARHILKNIVRNQYLRSGKLILTKAGRFYVECLMRRSEPDQPL